MWNVFWAIVCTCDIITAGLFLLILSAVFLGVVIVIINTFTGKLENMADKMSSFLDS